MISKKKEKKRKSIFTWPFRLFLGIVKKFFNSPLGGRARNLILLIYSKIEESIRFELVVVFGICFLLSSVFYSFANRMLAKDETISNIEYNIEEIRQNAIYLSQRLNGEIGEEIKSIEEKDSIQSILNEYNNGNTKIYITDLDGSIKFRVNGDVQDKIDIYSVINKVNKQEDYSSEKVFLYPLKMGEDRLYLFYYEIPVPYITYEYYVDENSFLALFLSVIIFIAIFIIITNKKMKYIEEIESGLRIISSGDLSYRIETRGKDEIKHLAENINNMAEEVQIRIEAERRAERTKNELITNVSHDLRTPLTSIMGYIGLIKEGKYENEKVMKDYLNIAFNKSTQLKNLIEDLFEYTKLSNRTVSLEKRKVNIAEFLSQIIEEYVYVFEENNLDIETHFEGSNSLVDIDPGKMVRVFENLISNAIKYSFKPGKISILTYEKSNYVYIKVNNKGENISKEKLDKIFDRFYRVDEARNSNVKGSGLGLAISKNIVELHNGEIWAECEKNNINFYVKLKLFEDK